ncbi:MAG: class I SAM-dependent methyltransferase [Pseudomonadota bacterium]
MSQSRLDLFVDRMVSQRACLDHAARLVGDLPGPVFELGLGNGRTYHHMCQIMPARDIYVFERAIASHPDSTPPDSHVLLGEVAETLPQALERFGPTAVLIHADLGGHNAERNDIFAREISPVIAPLLAVGGLMVSSDRMYFDDLVEQPLPADAVPGRCFIYRRDS